MCSVSSCRRCVFVCVCRSEGEEDGDSVTGTKVRVKYGRGKTQKIYEAHIKKTDTDNGEQFYLVHYYGWNVRSVQPRVPQQQPGNTVAMC